MQWRRAIASDIPARCSVKPLAGPIVTLQNVAFRMGIQPCHIEVMILSTKEFLHRRPISHVARTESVHSIGLDMRWRGV
jgi:hypothetical protein